MKTLRAVTGDSERGTARLELEPDRVSSAASAQADNGASNRVRIVINGPVRGADGVIVAFSEASDAVAQRQSASELRTAVLSEAPLWLEGLGIDHPFRRWKAVVEEMHRDRAAEEAKSDYHLRRVALLIRTQIAWERRGSPGWAPTRDDLEEAALEVVARRSPKAV
jgi:hypothetical protein